MSGDKAPHVVEDARRVLQLLSLSDGTFVRSDAEDLPPASFPDVPGVQWKDVVYDAMHGLRLRLYRPAAAEAGRLPVLVHFRGGGFFLGTAEHRHVHACCLRLATELPAVVLSADYRLAPVHHRLPAAIDDGVAVLSWVRAQASLAAGAAEAELWLAESADYARVFVSGESAGANTAHHVAVRCGSDQSALAPLHVAGCILLTAFFAGAERTASEAEPPDGVPLTIQMSDQFWRLSMPAGATRDHPAANPFGPDSPSLSPIRLPPVLVVAARRDLLRFRLLGYFENLKAMEKSVELADFAAEEHGFFVLQPWGEAATELIQVMKNFLLHNSIAQSN